MVLIKVLTGSVRPSRFNIQPAQWIYELTERRTDASVELLDLLDIQLPFLDEPIPPSQRQYSKDYTKKWSKKIDEADGFIFVTPEYNHGVSPVLKNAIDYLWYEWHYKPVSFVSYGSQAGGTRSVEHWRGIAAELKLYDLREQIMFPDYWDDLDEKGRFQFTERHERTANKILDDLIFWAEIMKGARKKLANET
jgi:NAD(P)H-dependent FMN reductase